LEKLTILGCGSALPASGRHPTSQVLEHNGKFILIDCGEGTQSRLRENKISFDKITHVFISHLHGDHYFGLAGLLSTMSLLGRTRTIELYGPPALIRIIELQFEVGKTFLSFSLLFKSIEKEEEVLKLKGLTCRSIELNHRLKCFGFVFAEEKKLRRINGSAVKELRVPHFFMENLRKGEDYVNNDGVVYKNTSLTFAPKKSHIYAFCSDNRIKSEFYKKLKKVSILYHESTFLHQELAKAKKTFHSTAKEAALLAKEVNVDLLILGHYSARYNSVGPFLEEARLVFNKTIASHEKQFFDFSKI
jgi:ribonuclease Z